MSVEEVTNWIGVIDRALPLAKAEQPPRPCHYGPWAAALLKLEKIDAEWPKLGRHYYDAGPSSLMACAHRVSRPGWPDEHAHLVEFALRFLEADVMLMSSGYAKRHLLRRLRQASLTTDQTGRAIALVKRAVTDGTGLEEFREFCRLATRLITDDLHAWLSETAEGAYITISDIDGEDLARIELFDTATRRKVTRYGFNLRPNYAFRSDFSLPVIKTSELTETNKTRKNAWRMLRHIERVGASRPRRQT